MTRRSGFTLIELVAVMIILGILAGIAIPRYIDSSAHARHSAIVGLIGGVQEGTSSLEMAYLASDTAGLPPDADANGFPDHIGDLALGEPTLFDAVLDPPFTPEPNGWKQYAGWAFPLAGRYYGYHYDVDGDALFDFAVDALLVYDAQTGQVLTYVPPDP